MLVNDSVTELQPLSAEESTSCFMRCPNFLDGAQEYSQEYEHYSSKQIEQIGDLQVANTEYQRQAEEAMAIFRDHDLTILSRRRPNMIEDRANDATKAVFDAVEQDSRDISQLNEQKDEENSN